MVYGQQQILAKADGEDPETRSIGKSINQRKYVKESRNSRIRSTGQR